MSYELTPERLQGIAVEVVSKFITKQASLSDAISDKAKTLELNPEQIKRVIETSNTIAYLRQLEDAKDRSFEFPVATYQDVMGKMVLPDQPSPTVSDSTAVSSVTKVANEVTSSMSDQEKVAMLRKETIRVRQTLTKMAEEGVGMSMQLEQIASRLQKDPFALEKLASVASAEDLPLLKTLCGLEKSASTSGSVFKTTELKEAMTLNSLFKEAKEMITTKKEAEAFIKKATEVLEKVALKSVTTPEHGPVLSKPPKVEPGILRKGINSAVGAPVELAGKVVGKTIRGVGKGVVGVAKGIAHKVTQINKGNSLTGPKTLGQKLEGTANLGGAVLAGATMQHENPVWDSLHN